MESKRYHIFVHGRVHGVFFRYNTEKLTKKIEGITGFVKNLPDGTVEVVAEGEESKLKELLQFCKEGPLIAKVKKIVVQEEKPTGEFKGFEIRY